MTKKIVDLLNIRVNNLTRVELLERLRNGGIVITPNVDHLINLQKDPEFYRAYQKANYRVCDSKILHYASKFLGTPITEKISGSDLFPAFYQHYKNDESIKIFLLGAAQGVAEKAKQRINEKVGREIVVAAYSPSMGFEKSEAECQKIIELINQSSANVLAIGVGSPKQEKWIAKYGAELTKITTFLAIGATIDFEAGSKSRAPKWMSEVGLEWAYRLVNEPKRLWKRYLIDGIPFFWLILQQKLNIYRLPYFQLNSQPTPPIGKVLLEKELISLDDLNYVLKIQKQLNDRMKLGDIFLHLGLISEQNLEEALIEQHQRLSDQTSQSSCIPIGNILVSKHLISSEDLNNVLEVQKDLDGRMRIGEILLHLGLIAQAELEQALIKQK